MTTYPVTPTLFVGVESPDGVAPVVNLSATRLHTDQIVDEAVDIISDPGWDGLRRPAVVVPTTLVAFRVLRRLGLTEEQAHERCRFPLRMWLGVSK